MLRIPIRHFYCLFLLIGIFPTASLGQAATSATLSGFVRDAAGNPIVSATITAIHNPTGTLYTASSQATGYFILPYVKLGGEYTVSATTNSYGNLIKNQIVVNSGQNLRIDFVLSKISSLPEIREEVTIKAGDETILDSERTGVTTTIGKSKIESMPTLNRSLADFIRLDPRISVYSAGGRNNRYNNIQVDGALLSDVYALDSSGIPGGQTGTNPISIDVIEELQVLLASYDVRYGNYTGASINAITRSGTNKYHGSLYFFGRNEKFVGDSPDNGGSPFPVFKDTQWGVRIGGPIYKDKLFFFISPEWTKRSQPLNFAIGGAGVSDFGVPASVAQQFVDILVSKGYDPGSYGVFVTNQPSSKGFARADWNINTRHQFSIRDNYVSAGVDRLGSQIRSVSQFGFSNFNHYLSSITNSAVAQVSSVLGPKTFNEFRIGLLSNHDKRFPSGAKVPQVSVNVATGKSFLAGWERNSQASAISQRVLELTDNLTFVKSRHRITLGTHNEFIAVDSLAIQDLYGAYEFNSLTDLINNRPSRFRFSYSLDPNNPMPAAKFKVAQLGFYIQDVWAIAPNLNVVMGLRWDPLTFDRTPPPNPNVEASFGIRTDVVPKNRNLFSPRIGFNWNVKGKNSTLVRGGIGIFRGRAPYVWVANQYANSGTDLARIDARNLTFFSLDPDQQRALANSLPSVPTTAVNVADKDFKFPSIARLNVGIDQKLPWNLLATLDFLYSRSLNDPFYEDLNLLTETATVLDAGRDNRLVYGTFNGRNATRRVRDSRFTNVIKLTNTNQGFQYNFAAQIQKKFSDNWHSDFAYSFGRAKDKNALVQSIAAGNWQQTPTNGNPNDPPLTISNFDLRNKVVFSFSYKKSFFENFETALSAIYVGQSGKPFSYTYEGDVNADGSNTSPGGGNDMIYVPLNASDIVLTTNNWDALNAFIENDPYLKTVRGKIAERNGGREPWSNQLDVRISQDIPLRKGSRMQITFDILNLLNLANSQWGHVRVVAFQNFSLLRFEGLSVPDSNGVRRPTFSFNDSANPLQFDQVASRWQAQIGVRFSF